ncbi:MAG: hypothetical protein ACXU82_07015 [Caulobacteraceae bacterium]
MTQAAGRIAAWPPWLARLLLLLAAVLTLSTVTGPQLEPPPPSSAAPGAHYTDRELYRDVVLRVGQGQDYYAAAAAAQRAHGYPTSPPWVIREPTVAWMLALMPGDLVRWAALMVLAAAAVVMMRDALDQVPAPAWMRIAATLLFGLGLATVVAAPSAPYLHENWAAVLIGLSLASWRAGEGGAGGRWRLAAGFGLLACLVREIALPYLLAMAAFAAMERRRGEFLGWATALALLAAALAAHLYLAARQHLAADGLSPGWLMFGGWPFAVLAARRNMLLALLPAPLASLVLLAGWLGLVSMRSPWTWRIAGTAGVFLAAFMAIGRPDNYYWGVMVAPIAAMGLPFAPGALRDLLRAAFRTAGVRPAA